MFSLSKFFFSYTLCKTARLCLLSASTQVSRRQRKEANGTSLTVHGTSWEGPILSDWRTYFVQRPACLWLWLWLWFYTTDVEQQACFLTLPLSWNEASPVTHGVPRTQRLLRSLLLNKFEDPLFHRPKSTSSSLAFKGSPDPKN